ncbi:MAG: ATP-binding protein, partial [Anaerolineae bacterium]
MAVVMDGDPTGPDVNGDPSRLRHAIEALIRNAIQYSPHGGTLRVTVGKVGGEALIVFQDEG